MRPPTSEVELLQRARNIAGRTIGELALRLKQPIPDTTRAKGFVGQLIEKALGASAGNRGEPDFVEIGVELKTLPVRRDGRPKETTFVASLPLASLTEVDFEDSLVAHKIARVLWVPIEAEPTVPLRDRRVGGSILWSPTPEQVEILRADYEQIAALVLAGKHDTITGHLGTFLQVRPKAANATVRGHVFDSEGRIAWTGPRGFYLRKEFTQAIVSARSTLRV